VQRDLGNDIHTKRFRRTRRAWWQGLRGQGALELRQFLAEVSSGGQRDPVEVGLDVLERKQGNRVSGRRARLSYKRRRIRGS
jgi:hypothetical protein